MVVSKQHLNGNISVSLNAIAAIAGNAACECYGVLGLASQNPLRDDIYELLGTDNFIRGLTVKEGRLGIEINLYIVVAYGLKITEIVSEVQKKVRYVLKKALDLNFSAINVYVQSIKKLG